MISQNRHSISNTSTHVSHLICRPQIFHNYSTHIKAILYLYKAINIIAGVITIKNFLNLKYKKVEVGLSSYDTFIRYTANPNLKSVNNELIVILAECLYHCDYFENLFKKNKQIKFAVQSETVFNPLNSFFQICLK